LKTLTFLLFLTATLYAQNDSTFDIANENIRRAGEHLSDAGAGFNRSFLFPLSGGMATGIIIAVSDKVNVLTYIPALIGSLLGIINYFNATSDMREAGRYLQKVKRK